MSDEFGGSFHEFSATTTTKNLKIIFKIFNSNKKIVLKITSSQQLPYLIRFCVNENKIDIVCAVELYGCGYFILFF
jgi:hypothetical protein